MNQLKSIIRAGLLGASFLVASCGSLDLVPYNEQTSASVYNDPTSYRQVLAKVYAGLAVTGQSGPDGRADISGGDEGFSSYLRQYWQLQELTTDEAIIRWNDAGLPDLHNMTWTAGNQFIQAMYYRLFYQITLCNEFIRESTDAKLSERGQSGQISTDVRRFRAEARFMRALSYYHAIDLFGNVPFVTEADTPGAFFPSQISRADLFAYIESELKAIETDLADPRTNEYGRADKAAAWMLLAKLYLNAQVYTSTAKWSEAADYSARVIKAGYVLTPTYTNLFRTDNNTSREIIMPIAFDGTRTRTWGGMTYLVNAQIGGSLTAQKVTLPNGTEVTRAEQDFGVTAAWSGLRTTSGLVNKFTAGDSRAQFWRDGQTVEIDDPSEFTQGLAVTKYRNISSTGVAGSDPEKTFPDTDYPLFRLAEAHLTYVEAVLQGGTAVSGVATPIEQINALRQRAFGNASGNLSAINLQTVLDERARELFFEGTRRTDLIRYGQFTTAAYPWPWKGGVRNGRAVEDFRNLFPIPSAELIANPGLRQNEGYR